jgi:hypothetical protein
MFLGHIGVGLAAKRVAPRASLGMLLTAAVALDVLIGVLLLPGINRIGGELAMDLTHGLFMSGVLSLVVFAVVLLAARDVRLGLVMGLLVFSHWVLDFISHPMGMGRPLPPDLPLFFSGSPKVGLGLYNSMAAALVTELGLLGGGIILYLTGTRSKDRTGSWAFWIMAAFLAAMPLSSLLPPSLTYVTCLATLALLPIGIWIDRHRTVRPG